MSIKHYDVVRAASPSDLAEKLTHKLKEGWQPFGSPVAITPYTLMQAITAEGDVVVSGATEPDWYYVIVLAGQSNAMAYGEGLPLPDSYDAPDPRIKQLARRSIKHYDVVRAASPSDLAEKLTHKLKEGWQPFGSPVAITPYTLMQAITAEGDVVVSGATEPDWYYVIVLAGQSNAMAYGEGLPLPDSYDAPDPRIKQLARRSTVTPGGAACRYNDIIPADHCLHDVQDMSTLNHPKADLSKGQYGCVGQGLHIAKKLLPYIPNNAGILLVPCCRGGSAFTQGAEGTFSADTGASQDSARWGVGKPLYQDLIARTKAALQKNPKNVLLAVCWMQGEFDMSAATYAQQPALFTAMLKQFRADLTVFNAQCHGG
uniref:SASA family carbohydrate esterase n=1 Tax=Escherichia coli TaxID=562 RepID=UPI00207B4042